MKVNAKSCIGFALLMFWLVMSGCGFLGRRAAVTPNYYILDYMSATENPELVQQTPFDKTIEVLETKLPRTYDRNQIVRKKSFMQISFYPYDLWSTRLHDAVPNLIVRRLSAYKIFRNVSRNLEETRPDYYLESFIQNIEYVEGSQPYAFLRMEISLRDSRSQAIVFTSRNERAKILYDNSVAYLVQSFNEMIMAETDFFAEKCINYLRGKEIKDTFTVMQTKKAAPIIFTEEDISPGDIIDANSGELKVPSMIESDVPKPFEVVYADTLKIRDDTLIGTMNEVMVLHKGKWKLILGSEREITENVIIRPNMRTVVTPFWSELIVRLIDQSQSRVKMRYDVYEKSLQQDAFIDRVSSKYSPSDEVGEDDYLWVLKPGKYMITVNGASPNDLRDFATINLEKGKSHILTMVVNPDGDRSVLIGAGTLEAPATRGRLRIHKGALHANLSLTSNNAVSRDNPTQSFSLSGEFDNKLNYDVWPLHYTTTSLYDLGFNMTTGAEFRVNVDNYSLKNSLAFYPWRESRFLKNLGIYGRGDVNTHFFEEYKFFPSNTNIMKVSQEGEVTRFNDVKKLKVKNQFYPLRLRKGTGLIYRLNLFTNASVNLRTGFGWQQDIQDFVYSHVGTETLDGVVYERYVENPSSYTRGLETSVLIGINNVLGVISLSSTIDVLFPVGNTEKATIYDSENLLNIRIYRNVSLDLKAKIKYNKALRDYILTDYNAFLRLSYYY